MPTTIVYKWVAVAAAIATFPVIAFAANVARVDFAVGNVAAIGPDGRSRPLTKGSEIEVGDTVSTQQGRAQLRFADGAYMSLQPGTEFKVEQFRWAGQVDGNENIVMNLIRGGMRTVTGLIGKANAQNYLMRTDTATIGIRGTAYSVRYTNSIEVFCADGAISVENQGGTLVLTSGQGAFVPDFQTQPRRTGERPFLPPERSGAQQQVQQVSNPTNPIQDFAPPALIAPPTLITPLTGSFTGNWAVSAFSPGLGHDMAQPITMDESGALRSFADATVGTAMAQSAGNDGIIAWGRWLNGITGGSGILFAGADLTTQPMHYVVGLPVTNMPTRGVATYDMLGSSASCSGLGCTSAVVNSSSFNVNFGQGVIAFNMTLTIDGGLAGTYKFVQSTSPISVDRSNGQITGISGNLAGPALGGLAAVGFLSGDGASRAGLAWSGAVSSLQELSTSLNGVTAYRRQ